MMTVRRGWSKPATILFATELPTNEKAFSLALAQAVEGRADLILFHVCRGECAAGESNLAPRSPDFASARAVKEELDPMVRRARDLGVNCRVVVRAGSAAEGILHYAHEHKVDRVVMGVHTPGPVGKLLVGSTAEAVLRKAQFPVTIVGPFLEERTFRNLATRTILCPLCNHPTSPAVVRLAAEVAARHGARLILQQIIPPQEAAEVLAGRTPAQIESSLMEMIPPRLREKLDVRVLVTEGDPIEELLYQGRVEEANLIVMGAHGASRFAAITHAGPIYKVLAYARCPVMTLSPVLLAESKALPERESPARVHYIAGVV
jgi:nucleotide-binding universal stress UspA family protein